MEVFLSDGTAMSICILFLNFLSFISLWVWIVMSERIVTSLYKLFLVGAHIISMVSILYFFWCCCWLSSSSSSSLTVLGRNFLAGCDLERGGWIPLFLVSTESSTTTEQSNFFQHPALVPCNGYQQVRKQINDDNCNKFYNASFVWPATLSGASTGNDLKFVEYLTLSWTNM